MVRTQSRRAASTERAVATKAALRAAARLGLSHKAFGRIIGVSEATVSRMGSGSYTLAPGEKPFEMAMLFIRAATKRWLLPGCARKTARSAARRSR